MIAARLATLPLGANQHRQNCLPTATQEQAAEMLNVSVRTAKHSRVVLDNGEPELVHAVEQGKITVSLAATAVKLPIEQQREIAAKAFAGDANVVRTTVKKARRQQREAELGRRQLASLTGKYGVVYADPEWQFEPYSTTTGMDRAASNHYLTSATRIIAERDVPSICADDCILFLWATGAMMPQALVVMESWGFSYVSQSIWVKPHAGTGYWFRSQHELLLVGVKGNIPCPAPGTQWPSVVFAPAIGHSVKPAVFAEMIEHLFPSLAKIELNCRGTPRPSWEGWGLECEQPAAAAE